MLKKILILLVFLLSVALSAPAFAGNMPVSEIKAFGFTDQRQRHSTSYGPAFHGLMQHLKGRSYSQPLILNCDQNGWGDKLEGRWVAVTVENNVMYGLLLPSTMQEPLARLVEPEVLWSVKLHGDSATKSHPTFYEADDGRKYIFIGTYSKYIDIIDVTDFENSYLCDSKESNYATDITSAPLILKWRGHDIVICTSGNSGKAFIVADPLDKSKTKEFYINVGAGRTSSSPAPVDGGKGFAVGLDGGPNYGELQIYYLDEILKETADGKVEQKSYDAHYVKQLKSGLCASFSVKDNLLFFGDSQSRIYMFNTQTGNLKVNDKHPAVGTFSNRSPAIDLYNNLLLFPAVGTSDNGKIVAIDLATGNTAWVHKFSSRAQTAPIVTTYSGGTDIWAGSSDGWLVGLNPEDGKRNWARKFSDVFKLDSYAWGVSGEISAVGPFYLVSTEEGVRGGWLADYVNFQAISIDPGLPEGEKAQPGQTYHGTATFKYEKGLWAVMGAGIGVFYGDQYLKLTDENGNELEKFDWADAGIPNWGANYELDMEKGREVTIHFDWTANNNDTLTALINLNQKPVKVMRDETTFEDNKVTAAFDVDIQNLKVEITKYMEEAKPGDPVSVGARIINESGEMIVTRLIAKVNGSMVKDIDIFDLIRQQDVAIEFTMPDDDAEVEFIVNPDRDKPAYESDWTDNTASCTVSKVIPLPARKGDIKVDIIAPGNVEPFKYWDFKVIVSGYFPPPPPLSDEPPYANVTLHVTGESKNIEYRFSGGTWGDVIVTNQWPSIFDKTIRFRVIRGEDFVVKKTFTFQPSSGYPGRDMAIPLHARASWRSYEGEDSTAVNIFRELLKPSVKQTL